MDKESNQFVSLQDLGINIAADGELEPTSAEAELILASAHSRFREVETVSTREQAMLTFIDFEKQKYQEAGHLGITFGQNEDTVLIYRFPVTISNRLVRYLAASRYGFAWMDILPKGKATFNNQEIKFAKQSGLADITFDQAKESPLLSFNLFMKHAILFGGQQRHAQIYFADAESDATKVPRISPESVDNYSYGNLSIGGNLTNNEYSLATPVTSSEIRKEMKQYLNRNHLRFLKVIRRDQEVTELVTELIGNTIKDKRAPWLISIAWSTFIDWLHIRSKK